MSGTAVMVVVVVVAVFVLVGAATFAVAANRRIRRFARSNEIIPGLPGNAPADWARSPEPEAVLHRRIRYALDEIRQNPGIVPNDRLRVARDELERAAVRLDDALIASSTLPADHRIERRETLETAVDEVEKLPGIAYTGTVGEALTAFATATDRINSLA
ncbi:hypothetical protein [Williamsia sterculiae]|uniref:Uncharacterized protein n=1 Tax=Williamsia sterculiae TaxID=1344003 RepID=A0A1N7EEL8_9NOCA|nr:hypothetical protein [Williamsia sterculiae]SIR86510.1 hypothetical protein SAMN05445060_1226 [Williamsia sterculiae]